RRGAGGRPAAGGDSAGRDERGQCVRGRALHPQQSRHPRHHLARSIRRAVRRRHRAVRLAGDADPDLGEGAAGLLDRRADGLHAAAMRTRRLLRRAAAHRRPFALQGPCLPVVGEHHRSGAGVLDAQPRGPAASGAADPRAGRCGRPDAADRLGPRHDPAQQSGADRAGIGAADGPRAPHGQCHRRAAQRLRGRARHRHRGRGRRALFRAAGCDGLAGRRQ
ncbi:hypothetical protein KXV85_001464, partial [Aspergillus fumigatus]